MTNKKDKNTDGFAALELLLIVVIIILIAGAGWYVYKKHHKTASNSSTTSQTVSLTQTYIDTTGWFMFKFPSSWVDLTAKAGTTVQSTSGPVVLPANAAGELGPSNLNKVVLLNVGTASSSLTPEAFANTATNVSQGKSETINGYSAYFDVTTSNGETNRNFIVADSGKIAVLSFVLTNGNTSYASYENIENTIAGSVQFEN